jgi:hypothetical protein
MAYDTLTRLMRERTAEESPRPAGSISMRGRAGRAGEGIRHKR